MTDDHGHEHNEPADPAGVGQDGSRLDAVADQVLRDATQLLAEEQGDTVGAWTRLQVKLQNQLHDNTDLVTALLARVAVMAAARGQAIDPATVPDTVADPELLRLLPLVHVREAWWFGQGDTRFSVSTGTLEPLSAVLDKVRTAVPA